MKLKNLACAVAGRRKLLTLTTTAAIVAAFGVGTVQAVHLTSPPEYGDHVPSFARDDVQALPGPHADENNTLGEEDGGNSNGWFNLGDLTGTGGSVTVEFTNNIALPDGNMLTDDLTVWEAHSYGVAGIDNATVEVSNDGVTWAQLSPNATDDPNDLSGVLATFANSYDLDVTGLAAVRFVRIRNTDDDGDPSTDIGADGFDVDAVEALNSFNLGTAQIDKEFVQGSSEEIIIQAKNATSNGLQYYSFVITIENTEDQDLSGIVFEDVLPAEFDLDPVGEDYATVIPINEICEDTPICDGVWVTGGTNPEKCTATGAEHTNNGKSGKLFQLQPDIITITADTLGDDESCEITVWASTDQKSDRPNKVPYTPTACNEDTFIYLNEGVKVIDTSGTEDVVLFRDDDQLVLTCADPTFGG